MTRNSQDGTRPEGARQAGDETAAEAGTEAGAAGSGARGAENSMSTSSADDTDWVAETSQFPPVSTSDADATDAAATGDAAGSTELEPLPESVEIPAAEDASAQSTSSQNPSVNGSRAGTTWVALIIGAVVLVLLLLFILQNLDSVRLQMFVWEWNFPIGIGMLIAALGGALVMACVGGVRMIQLRHQISHPDRKKKSKKSKKKSRRKR